MKDKHKSLRGKIRNFTKGLLQHAQQLNSSVSTLSKALEHKPLVGCSTFQETLSIIQDEISDIRNEVEILEQLTVDDVSLEELLGHSTAVYHATRRSLIQLEDHVQQFGYRQPPDTAIEPEDPLSAEAVAAAAAARAQLKGDKWAACDSSSEEEDDEEDARIQTSLRGLAMNSSFENSLVSPPSTSFQTKSRNIKENSVAKARPALPFSYAGEDERRGVRGNVKKDAAGEEKETRPDKRIFTPSWQLHQPCLPPGADATAVVGAVIGGHSQSTWTMAGKSHFLVGAQAASLSTAATASASLHKAQMPRQVTAAATASSRSNSVSPVRMYSPATAQLIAKMNPSEAKEEDIDEKDLCPVSLAVSFDMARLPDPTAKELSTALRDLAPFGQRRTGNGDGIGTAYGAAVGTGTSSTQLRASGAAPHVRPLLRPPSDEDDTRMLYQDLIRKPCSPPVQNPQQPKAFVPPLNIGKRAGNAMAIAEASLSQRQLPPPPPPPQQQQSAGYGPAASNRAPLQVSPRLPQPPPAGCTPERDRPGTSRCATPLSALRANREQHNKLLAEKMAGLEREWIESGQAALTPMRKSLGGATANGDLMPFIRAISPGPARVQAEAAAPAAAGPVHPQPVMALYPERSLHGAAAATNPRMQGQKDVEPRARVLSPVQPFVQAAAAVGPATGGPAGLISCRESRGSGLPGPPSQAGGFCSSAVVSSAAATAAVAATAAPAESVPAATTNNTTVVGATTLPRRDISAGDASLRSLLSSKPSASAVPRTPTRPGRSIGTPGRVPQASSSPTITMLAAASRRADPATPNRAMRMVVAASTSAASAAELRASKLTPNRRSYAAAPLDATVATATAAAAQVETLTAGAVRKVAVTTLVMDIRASASVVGSTPGRTRTAAAVTAAVMPKVAPPLVPQLHLDACHPPDVAEGRRVGDAFAGFPLSRRGTENNNGVGTHPVSVLTCMDISDAGSSPDEVTLGMPPSVSNPDTPKASTPGGRTSAFGAPAFGTLSPNAARLASHPLGDIFGRHARPTSRIPTPNRSASAHSRLATGASRSCGAATTSTTALSTSLEPCSEEEWRTLPGSLQLAFPLEVLNAHMRTLAQVLANKPPQDHPVITKSFSAADLEPLSVTNANAKRLLNLLVKLGRCEVISGIGIGSGSMLYRLLA